MSGKILPILAILTLVGSGRGYSLDAGQTTAARSLVDSILLCRFDGALVMADSITTADTTDPLGPFFSLCVFALRDVDRNSAEDSIAVWKSYRSVLKRIEAKRTSGESVVRLSSLEGLSKAVYAAHCLNGQRYSPGVQAGLQSLKILKAVKAAEPGHHDADFILGTYECGKAELRQRLWWVLFWYPGSVKEGIAMLENCSQHAVLSGRAADLALIEIYTKQKQFDQAKAYIDKLSALYPGSRFVRWSKAKYFDARSDWKQSAALYAQLETDYSRIPQAWRNGLATRYQHARALANLGRKAQAADLCNAILRQYEKSSDPAAKSVCKDARELLKEVQ